MKPRISMITLEVRDLAAAVKFYEGGLGFPRMESLPEVDEVCNLAIAAGATLVKKPQKVFWGGYSCYFQDHLWEVAHTPFFWVGRE